MVLFPTAGIPIKMILSINSPSNIVFPILRTPVSAFLSCPHRQGPFFGIELGRRKPCITFMLVEDKIGQHFTFIDGERHDKIGIFESRRRKQAADLHIERKLFFQLAFYGIRAASPGSVFRRKFILMSKIGIRAFSSLRRKNPSLFKYEPRRDFHVFFHKSLSSKTEIGK